jgi:hypothetical protein
MYMHSRDAPEMDEKDADASVIIGRFRRRDARSVISVEIDRQLFGFVHANPEPSGLAGE